MYIVQSSKIKNRKKVKNSRNQGFSYFRTNNAGTGIRSQIKEAQKQKDPRIQIRIHNTGVGLGIGWLDLVEESLR
jgi:hypothetical protein